MDETPAGLLTSESAAEAGIAGTAVTRSAAVKTVESNLKAFFFILFPLSCVFWYVFAYER